MWADLVRGGFIQEGAINWVLEEFYWEEGKPFQAKGMNSIINGMFADSETVLLRGAKGFVEALWKYLSLVCSGITSQKLFLPSCLCLSGLVSQMKGGDICFLYVKNSKGSIKGMSLLSCKGKY